VEDRESRLYKLLVESVKDYGIFILSPAGVIETWNEGAQRLKGYSAAEIIGKHFSIFYPREDVAAGKCERELATAVEEGRFEEEGWRVRKDGTLFWANVTITALREPGGDLVGFAKVTRDLTERRQAEEHLRELAAEKAALTEKRHTQEFQERFLAILGHDLRNPLAAMDMAAALLRQQNTSDAGALRILDRFDSSSRRMTRMIEQILDLTRSRLSGSFVLSPTATDLTAVLAAIIDELSIAHPGRTLSLHSPASSIGQWDRDRLEQVFSNLLGNAVQYGVPDKPVTITVGEDGDLVTVDVYNDGPPIPDELREKLFDPFRRGSRDSRTAATAGLGLGLYISRELVRAHGGDIVVRSTASEGTNFRVWLPRAPIPTTGPAEEA
jgi:PAS domain S-box-containing protein